QIINITWAKAARSERVVSVFRRLADTETPALTQNQCDQVDILRQKERLALADLLTRYRDRLDELKVTLGISPHVPVVLDTTPFAPFSDVFSASDRWQGNAGRRFEEIPALANRLPALEDLVIEGRSLLAFARVDVDRPEELCQAAATIARRRAKSAPA